MINGLGTGGAERSLGESLPHLVRRGVEPIIVCLEHRREGIQVEVLRQGFDVRFVPSSDPLGRVRHVRRLLRELRPRLVHTCIFESDVIGRLAAVRMDVPVLSSVVNTSYAPVRLRDPRVRGWRLTGARLVDGWTARRLADHIHAISNTVARAAVRALKVPPERVTVIERGRDPRLLGEPTPQRRRAVRERLGLPHDIPLVLNVGRQEFQKGQAVLLHAASVLTREHPDAVVLVAGRAGNASRELRRLHERLALGDRVRFLGHRDDVPDLLAAADVFAFPSLFEGLGGAVIEAMGLGVPVVASDLPALREVVEERRSGMMVPPGDARALVWGILRLLDDRESAQRMGTRARSVFLERFTLEQVVERMADLYATVIDSAR